MTDDSSTISQSLKELRKKLGLTQEALAHKLGVSFTSVNRWENGQTQPSPLARRLIAGLEQTAGQGSQNDEVTT